MARRTGAPSDRVYRPAARCYHRQMSATPLRYRLSVPEPERHLARVELRLEAEGGDPIDLEMAAWCPGSYVIRDYARFVRGLQATGAEGAPLPVHKIDKQTWRVEGAAGEVTVVYEVYGHDLSVRTNHIDGSHAFLHGPATFLAPRGARERACELELEPPDGRDWQVAVGLPGSGRRYRAVDLDELLDAPVHLGPEPIRTLEAAGAPVRLVIWGLPERTRITADDLAADLTAIIETHAARFGGVPYDDYTFILMLSPGAYGGLEHRSSSANLHEPGAFAGRKAYTELLELLSHEYFHVWNGKRIAPAAFMPLDYGREAYTRCLWVVEGLTSYYDRLTVLRAGRMSPKRYFEKLAEDWIRLLATPGRRLHSLEESSFDAWIKLYRPDESNVNTTVSYYLKGGLVSLALDLEIRRRSNGDRCLDDVIRHLWDRFGARGAGYPEDIQPVFEEAAAMSLASFFDRHIRGTDDPDLAGELARVGLELRALARAPDDDAAADPVWLGVVPNPGSAVLGAVLDGSPAAGAGISPADELVAVDGLRVRTDAELRAALAAASPGQEVELALFRRGRLLVVPVALERSAPSRVEICGLSDPDARATALFRAWLGQDHPGPGSLATATASRWI